ncbi:MAG: hypothetical protein ACI9K2_006851 [Myxococcota bacterium]|jgi:hypothetical protein
MAGAVKISVSDRQRIILDRWCRNKADTAHRLIERCRIILMSVDGVSNVEQARRLAGSALTDSEFDAGESGGTMGIFGL